MMKDISGHMAMLLCVLCWSTSGLFITFIDWHPLVISCIRSAIAAIFMLAVQGKPMFALFSAQTERRFRGVPVLLAAAFVSAATKILYITANKLTMPANAILLQHSAPIWAAVFGGLLLGETLRRIQWVALIIVLGGLCPFLFDGIVYGKLLGDGVAILSGMTFALSMVFLRRQKEGSPALTLFFPHLIPVIIGIPFLFTNPPHWTPLATGAVLFLGIVQIGAASLLYAAAIHLLPAIDAMLIAQLEPILNPAWVFFFFWKIPSRYTITGGLIITIAVIISNMQTLQQIRNIRREEAI